MNTVLSTTQAKQIAVRKTSFSIVPYETAVQALRECLTFDAVKHWTDYAAIARAWGEVHKSNEAIRLSKAVKLLAARRMGEMAKLAQPRNQGKRLGAHRVLLDAGVSRTAAMEAVRIAGLTKETVEEAAAQERPPSPGGLASKYHTNPWSRADRASGFSLALSRWRHNSPLQTARAAIHAQKGPDVIREQAIFMKEWLERFISAIPKKAQR